MRRIGVGERITQQTKNPPDGGFGVIPGLQANYCGVSGKFTGLTVISHASSSSI